MCQAYFHGAISNVHEKNFPPQWTFYCKRSISKTRPLLKQFCNWNYKSKGQHEVCLLITCAQHSARILTNCFCLCSYVDSSPGAQEVYESGSIMSVDWSGGDEEGGIAITLIEEGSSVPKDGLGLPAEGMCSSVVAPLLKILQDQAMKCLFCFNFFYMKLWVVSEGSTKA